MGIVSKQDGFYMLKIDEYSVITQLRFIEERRNNGNFLVSQPFTPVKLIREISDRIGVTPTSKVGVLYTIEWAVYLKSQGTTNITLLTEKEDPELRKHCSLHGFQYIMLTHARELDMKFDVVVGNPPYQDKTGNEESSNSTDLAAMFVKQSFELSDEVVALVIPSDWTGPNRSVLKNFLFNDVKLKQLNLYGGKWFDVQKDTCSFIYNKNYHGDCTVVDINNNSTAFDLSDTKLLSLDNLQTTFIQRFDVTNNLGTRWTRGALHLSAVGTVVGGNNTVEFICAVGKKNDPVTTTMIDRSTESTGFGTDKIVVPNVGEYGWIGNIKIATPTQVGGHSVVFLTTNSAAESQNLKDYLESKVIRLLVKSVKKSTPNSKAVFSQIPDIDLTRPWTDAELYKHFNLTQAEIDYVESYAN